MGILEIGGISIFVAFAAGLLSVASPCVLPLIPAYLGYLTGSAIDSPVPATATTAAATGGGVGGSPLPAPPNNDAATGARSLFLCSRA